MQPDELEIKQQADKKALRSALGSSDAEYLLRLVNGDNTLLTECLELAKRSAGPISITKWLHAKKGLLEPGCQAYRFCEAVLNLSLRRDRHA